MLLKTYLTIQQKLSFDSHIYMKHYLNSLFTNSFPLRTSQRQFLYPVWLSDWLLGQIAILAVVSIN